MQRTGKLVNDAALEFLAGRIDYERTSSVPYEQRNFRLDRMHQLLAVLGNPQDALPIVHVGGTKGKGSTAAMIASVLQSAGLRTGLYSSPHLDCVEERLAIDGESCPATVFRELVDELRPAVEAMDQQPTADQAGSNRPTYFEIITALALLRFARAQVDAAVLEVGLGGRLDSTNVCRPQVSVITSISLDHTQQLGTTLAAIAGEKAGIIKPGIPVVSGVIAAEPRAVIARIAEEYGSRLVQLGADFDFTYRPPRHLETAISPAHMDFRHRTGDRKFELNDVAMSLTGSHQAANAAVAIATVMELRAQGWQISDSAVRGGVASVNWPARIEVLSRHPTIVLDAAHNVASIEALVRVLDESFSVGRRILVFATSRDKDARGMLEVLGPKFDELIFTRYYNNPRGLAAETIAEWAAKAELPATGYQVAPDSAAAWQLAAAMAGRDDLICITGSFFIAAEMRAAIQVAKD